jgi:hypothetical protein
MFIIIIIISIIIVIVIVIIIIGSYLSGPKYSFQAAIRSDAAAAEVPVNRLMSPVLSKSVLVSANRAPAVVPIPKAMKTIARFR